MDGLSYSVPGATRVESATWSGSVPGFRRFERTVVLGHGEACWRRASEAVLEWAIKTRSGFDVRPAAGDSVRVRAGADLTLVAHVGPLRIREPIRIVAVVEEAGRCGFAYGTRHGHPVCGEEAFVVHRTPDGRVLLTLRSLTGAPRGRWRVAFPLALVAQRFYRRRYLRALAGC